MQETDNRKPWVIVALACMAVVTASSLTFALSERHRAEVLSMRVDELAMRSTRESETARNAANMVVEMFAAARPGEPVGRELTREETVERLLRRLAEERPGDAPATPD